MASTVSPPSTPTASAAEDPPAVTALGLSFATHLFGAMDAVKQRSSKTQSECGELARAMRDLAGVEESYAKGLRGISNRLEASLASLERSGVMEHGAVREALASVASNLRGSGELHSQLAEQIGLDVAKPLGSAKGEASAISRVSPGV